MKFMIGDVVKYVGCVEDIISTNVPVGEIGVITDVFEDDENIPYLVTFRYKKIKGLDYEWFNEKEIELVKRDAIIY